MLVMLEDEQDPPTQEDQVQYHTVYLTVCGLVGNMRYSKNMPILYRMPMDWPSGNGTQDNLAVRHHIVHLD